MDDPEGWQPFIEPNAGLAFPGAAGESVANSRMVPVWLLVD